MDPPAANSAVASTSGQDPAEDSAKRIGEKSGSCVPYFDALWFCYSPVHQLKEYYTYGTVDDCSGHWGKLMDCLKTKTTRYKESVPDDRFAGKQPLWQIRTSAEASQFWDEEFGHLDSSADPTAAAATEAEAANSGKTSPSAAGEAPQQRRGGMI